MYICVCVRVCVCVSIFMLLHAWAHDIADCCKQNSSLVESIVLYWIAKVAKSNLMHLLCLLCQEHFFPAEKLHVPSSHKVHFWCLCVYGVYIHTHPIKPIYIYIHIYTQTHTHTYIYIYIYCRDVAPSTVMSVWLKPLLESCKEIERLRAQ